MSQLTSQQLARYHEEYATIEVGFTRQVARLLRLIPSEVCLKVLGETSPCVIYSASMSGARVIAALRARSLQRLRQANFVVALRFAFSRGGKQGPLTFFVAARVTSHCLFNRQEPDLHLLTLEYAQRAPDDLIELLGRLLEANTNARRRKEVRIDITAGSLKALGLESKEATIVVAGRRHPCILRDLSFSGAKVLLFGAAAELLHQPATLEPSFLGHGGEISLPGKVLRYEEVVGREDIGAVALLFEEDKVPMSYKLLINDYLRRHPQRPDRPGPLSSPSPPCPPSPPSPPPAAAPPAP